MHLGNTVGAQPPRFWIPAAWFSTADVVCGPSNAGRVTRYRQEAPAPPATARFRYRRLLLVIPYLYFFGKLV